MSGPPSDAERSGPPARVDEAAMLRAVLDSSEAMIYVKDLQGRYLLANRRLLRHLGRTEEDLIGQDDRTVDVGLAPLWRDHDRRAEQGTFAADEFTDLPDGQRVFFRSVKFPLRDETGTVYATGGITTDITRHRQAAEEAFRAATEAEAAAVRMEEALRKADEASAAKATFLATMSHEIRTPLNAVIGMTDLLSVTALDDQQSEYAETIRTSAAALLSVINDVLDYSRFESTGLELDIHPFDLPDLLDDCLALVAVSSTNQVDLIADLHPDVPDGICSDSTRLRQTLVNLLGNAVKFTTSGEVVVAVRPADTPAPVLPGHVRLTFSVRDTGIGIPAERLDRLFQPFSQVDRSTTRRYGGSGLGLAISRTIVQALGGEITVSSRPGEGSTFTFTLTVPVAEQAPHRPGPDNTADLTGRRVMVVDDNDTNRRILRAQLESWGIMVTDLAGPVDAIIALAQAPVQTRPDAVLLDYRMPGLDGVELATRIRQLPGYSDTPMILLSSLTGPPPGDLFAGSQTKPVRARTLHTLLNRVIGLRRPPSGVGTTSTVATSTTAAGAVMSSGPTADTAARGSVPVPRSAPDRRGQSAPETVPGLPVGPDETRTELRILLAEDNLMNQRVALGMLGRLGHRTDLAQNGQEAIDALHRADYDLILMDVHMPVLDGISATRAIRAQLPAERQPFVIAMTAAATAEDRHACFDAGMNGFLLKPVRIADLAAAVDSVPDPAGIDRRHGGAALAPGGGL